MRIISRFRIAFPFLLAFCALPARAEYVVLKSGARLKVTGYQLIGDTYRLQLQGGETIVATSEVLSIEREEEFVRDPQPSFDTQSPYSELIQASAKRYGVDADLIASIIAAESNFDPNAVSRKNARGLMQLLPETAKRLGVRNSFDPKENIDAGTRYLSVLLQQYQNNLRLTLAAYNAGPVRVKQYGRVPPYRETRHYVERIEAEYSRRKTAKSAPKPTSNAG